MSDLILVLNCGSSSIKFAVFDANVDPLPRTPLWNGKVQGIGGGQPDFGETGVTPFPIELDAEDPYRTALQVIRKQVAARMGRHRIVAVAGFAHSSSPASPSSRAASSGTNFSRSAASSFCAAAGFSLRYWRAFSLPWPMRSPS